MNIKFQSKKTQKQQHVMEYLDRKRDLDASNSIKNVAFGKRV